MTLVKTFTKLIVLWVLIALSNSALATKYVEGTHYVKVTGLPQKSNQVTEFFSFYCPACFRQEPFMAQLKSVLPAGVSFNKSHVSGLPGRDKEVELTLSKALILAKTLKLDEQLIPSVFNEIHVNKKPIQSTADIKALFESHGVAGVEFDKGLSSFMVTMQANAMHKANETLVRQGISGVPSIVVNGKYKVLTKDIKSNADYQDIVLYLLSI